MYSVPVLEVNAAPVCRRIARQDRSINIERAGRIHGTPITCSGIAALKGDIIQGENRLRVDLEQAELRHIAGSRTRDGRTIPFNGYIAGNEGEPIPRIVCLCEQITGCPVAPRRENNRIRFRICVRSDNGIDQLGALQVCKWCCLRLARAGAKQPQAITRPHKARRFVICQNLYERNVVDIIFPPINRFQSPAEFR